MIHSIIKAINKIQPFIGKANSDNVFAIAGQSAFFIILSAFPLTMFPFILCASQERDLPK